WPRQRELLEKEGVRFKANGCADIARFMWEEIL
ncbi:MAG: cysteine methyltransferase, partial [Alistipes onderdonkii]|nr:cysteine methyltransferase [Alistipes onderdonkii]